MAVLETAGGFTFQPAVAGVIQYYQSMVGIGSTIVSTNDYDTLGNASPNTFTDIGIGPRPIYFVIQVGQTMTGSGSITAVVQQSANPGAGPYTTIQTLGVVPAASTTSFTPIVIPLLSGAVTKRYLSLSFTLSGQVTAGGLVGYMTPDPDLRLIYARGDTISTS